MWHVDNTVMYKMAFLFLLTFTTSVQEFVHYVSEFIVYIVLYVFTVNTHCVTLYSITRNNSLLLLGAAYKTGLF